MEYYRKFPDCCIVNYPPFHFERDSLDKRFFNRTNPLDANQVDRHRWVYDFVTFPQRQPGQSFAVQKQYFIYFTIDRLEGKEWSNDIRPKLPAIYRGVSACGVVDVTSNANWH